MSEGFSQQPHQALEYATGCVFRENEEYPEDISCQWMSSRVDALDYSQFGASTGAVNDPCFSDPFNDPAFSTFHANVMNNGLLFAPLPQPPASFFIPSPSTNTTPLPTPGLYSNMSSPWMLPTELDEGPSSGRTIPIRSHSIGNWSEGESPIHTTVPLTPGGAAAGGTNPGWTKQQRRMRRENIFHDRRYSTACSTIIDIMSVKVQVEDSIDPVGAISGVATDFFAVQKAHNELAEFIQEQDPDIQRWINSAAKKRVGSDANIKAAATRRAPVQKLDMFQCFWCKLYMTTKGNLSNHVRSHLGFHISFCTECTFSAVTPRIPNRHASSHPNFAALRQRGRGSM